MKSKLVKGLMVLGAVAVSGLLLSGCNCLPCDAKDAPAPKPKPAAKAMVSGTCPVVTQQGDLLSVEQAIPTGDKASSVLLLTKQAPAEVSVGQPYEYVLIVENLTDCRVDNVVVRDTIPQNVVLDSSAPQARLANNVAEWDMGSLEAKESKTIRMKASATATGKYTNCVSATYVHNLCLTVTAIEPKLALTKTMPAEVLICDDIPVKLVVSNTGTGTAKAVTVSDALPQGLATLDGQNKVSFDAGDLATGESREFTFTAKASATGNYTNPATAAAAGGLTAQASAAVTVRQPVLAITKTATEMIFAGRPIEYTVTVTNNGDAAAANVMVTDTLPAGTTFVSADQGGAYTGGVISWNAGTIAPKESKTFKASVRGDAQGSLVNVARAEGVCAPAVTAQAATEVAGIPAILLEVVDVSDPIEVGKEETYIITVTNQGSAPDKNVQIKCTLEDSEQYVSSSGATVGTAAGNVITFAPLASITAGDKAEWRVVVKAMKVADARFAVELTSDMLKRPVNENESTHLY
ncbi:MAG: hypothetical protein A3K19_26135 [Lentisphaerae bacterium RIFOXYB12_FULL_65_16]|nr:MAG: hypothetical protein A3K18_00455 [Lentisphaerae bacterium RIFOXYA12_64_32]OGV87748.1 MAG: hypothetical protein A3K19_26135 [Lentisphaerae bacterium RIFOXYB12_FULL_65_16]